MAEPNSYQEFLNLADQYNIDLTNDMSGIIPLLQEDNTELENILNKIVPEANRSNLLNELQAAIDKGSEQSLKEMILKNVDSDDKNIKDIAVDKIIKDSNIDIKDIPELNKTKFVDGKDLIRPNKLNKFDVTDFFGNIFDFYKKYGAVASGTPISDEALRNLVNEGKLTGSPEARPSIRKDAKKIVVDDEDQTVVTGTGSKSDGTGKGGTDGGQGAAMGEAAKALAALTKGEDSKDDRTKMQKFMDGLLSKDDFLMDLGSRLMKGEGLFPAVVDAAKTQKAADVKTQEQELAALELASKLEYNSALASQARAYALKAGLPPEKVQIAEMNALLEANKTGAEAGTEDYNSAYIRGFQDILTKTDSNPFLKNINDALTYEMLKDKFPELAKYVAESGVTDSESATFDSAVGPVELKLTDYLKNN